MAGESLSLSGLARIYLDALRYRENTIVFEFASGKGRFVLPGRCDTTQQLHRLTTRPVRHKVSTRRESMRHKTDYSAGSGRGSYFYVANRWFR
jgi:hypothetical protein